MNALAAAGAEDPVAHFLVNAGSVVGSATALGGVLGFVAGSILRDLDGRTEPLRWAERGAQLGGVFGLTVLGMRLAGL